MIVPTVLYITGPWSGSGPTPPVPIPTGQVESTVLAVYSQFRAILIASGQFTENNCVVTLERPESIYPRSGSPFCAIRPGGSRSSDPDVYGGGRYQSVAMTEFHVSVFIKNIIDTPEEDTYAVISQDVTLGVLSAMDAIKNTLQLCEPVDANGYAIVTELPRWVRTEDPVRHPLAREWLMGKMTFTVGINETMSPGII